MTIVMRHSHTGQNILQTDSLWISALKAWKGHARGPGGKYGTRNPDLQGPNSTEASLRVNSEGSSWFRETRVDGSARAAAGWRCRVGQSGEERGAERVTGKQCFSVGIIVKSWRDYCLNHLDGDDYTRREQTGSGCFCSGDPTCLKLPSSLSRTATNGKN